MAKARTMVRSIMQNRHISKKARIVALACVSIGFVVIGTAASAAVGISELTEGANPSERPISLPSEVKKAWQSQPSDGLNCLNSVCNEEANTERISNFPPAQPIDPSKPFVSEGQVLTAARLNAEGGIERANLPGRAIQTTMGEANRRLNNQPDRLIANDRPVWMVTVHGKRVMQAPEGFKPVELNVYTDVYDAPSGQLVLEAVGVEPAD